MGKRKYRKSWLKGVIGKSGNIRAVSTEPCRETVAMLKARVAERKEVLALVVELADRDILEYAHRNETIGNAYMQLRYAKAELKSLKAMK